MEKKKIPRSKPPRTKTTKAKATKTKTVRARTGATKPAKAKTKPKTKAPQKPTNATKASVVTKNLPAKKTARRTGKEPQRRSSPRSKNPPKTKRPNAKATQNIEWLSTKKPLPWDTLYGIPPYGTTQTIDNSQAAAHLQLKPHQKKTGKWYPKIQLGEDPNEEGNFLTRIEQNHQLWFGYCIRSIDGGDKTEVVALTIGYRTLTLAGECSYLVSKFLNRIDSQQQPAVELSKGKSILTAEAKPTQPEASTKTAKPIPAATTLRWHCFPETSWKKWRQEPKITVTCRRLSPKKPQQTY